MLCTGDAVFVPDLRPKSDSGSLDQHYKFVRLGEPSKLLVRLLDDDDPRANTPWTLEFAGRNFDGVTDDDGNLAIPIRGNTKSVTLRVGHPGDEDVYQLDLGDVEPIETDSGVVARLENLGYLNNQNADTGNLSEAVRAFQARHGMKTTGQLDGETREKLRIEHGS
ncbi:MAG: peptidoglycan-binding protein [Planctomycetes bacterium]|nr:peptidoglycan-binding protein [Planctomycetota bacterium]